MHKCCNFIIDKVVSCRLKSVCVLTSLVRCSDSTLFSEDA